MLGISTSKQVLCMPISGQNHLLEHFHFFSHLFLYQKVEKRKKCIKKEEINILKGSPNFEVLILDSGGQLDAGRLVEKQVAP